MEIKDYNNVIDHEVDHLKFFMLDDIGFKLNTETFELYGYMQGYLTKLIDNIFVELK